MSRIGNKSIVIPEEVNINIQDDYIVVKGKLGELRQNYEGVIFEQRDNNLIVKRTSEKKHYKAKHGLYRSLVNNMVLGVSKGFKKELELVGVGYRASNQGQKLDLSLGFSHNILFEVASEVKVESVMEKGKNPIIKIFSIDKQLLGRVAVKIRSFRKPEPYKGKGIRFVGEEIRRKAGKSA